MTPIIVAPSILSADLGRLDEEIAAIDPASADHLLVQAELSATVHLHRVLSRVPRARLRQLCLERGLEPAIAVDSAQNCVSAGEAVATGASTIVAGSAIFGAPD